MTSSYSDKYEMVVGLEVHVQLKTRSKAFCGCSADFGAPPNVNTCPVCLALPGALPVLNKSAVELAVRAALALNCKINLKSVFARKNYFYPDLPKGYQISQYDQPLAEHGSITIPLPDQPTNDGNGARPIGDTGVQSVDSATPHRTGVGFVDLNAPRLIGITRLHMEEDAGKSIHDRYPNATAVDLNRAGVPLVEIVSEPDMRSPAEAGAYLRTLKQILEYAQVSDVSMEEGSLRVDANVSARLHGETKLGTKTEVKNMNSFSGVERALQLEFERQCAALERGERILQQTMLWDANKGEVRPARSKEESHDYRYFPEPDLPPLVLEQSFVDQIGDNMPELPGAIKARFAERYGLSQSAIDVLTSSPALATYFENVVHAHDDAKAAANWVMGEVSAALKAENVTIDRFPVSPVELAQLLDMIRDGKVSHTAGKTIFMSMLQSGKSAEEIAEEQGLMQVGDDSALVQWIDEVFAEMPTEAARFKAGEKKLTGVLVGAVMRKSKGRADPKKVNQLIASRT
jgi:aspartyl-tRNA(Asn)/glutamyl-tRNA(Gln) amidotransferase subunit B